MGEGCVMERVKMWVRMGSELENELDLRNVVRPLCEKH